MRVLIAEDDPISRRVLQSALLKWGYEVDVVSNGRDAWEALQANGAPRMAVLDWTMPSMDGPQICRELRKRKEGPYVYTILLTSRSQKDDLVAGLQAGADDYVIKPFDPQELRVRLKAGKRVLDLQAELISAREKIRMQAIRDPLTGLPNRLLFADRLAGKLAEAARSGSPLSVMFLDLDNFKFVNDSLGHNMGDRLLKKVAERLSSTLRESDTLARMGGDEFTVILSDAADAAAPVTAARRMLGALSEPFSVGGRDLYVTGSIGISVYPRDGSDVETLVRNADAAMYRAKEGGKNALEMFTEDLNGVAMNRVNIASALRRAIERDELRLHYQTRVDLRTGLIPGVEALVRWQHPEMGLLAPASFIQIAEDGDLIEPITNWVIETACMQNKQWQSSGFLMMDVAVNISPKLLHRVNLIEAVQSALTKTSLEPQYLTLELTETGVMHNPEHAVDVLNELRDMGVHLCVDDFGTGYSSLSLLKRLPIDALKIDASFIKHVTVNRDDRSIAAAIVAMAHSMGLRVTAEGVETVEQLDLLKELGCDEVQGYFISRPVPPEELIHLLAEGRPPLMDWMQLAA